MVSMQEESSDAAHPVRAGARDGARPGRLTRSLILAAISLSVVFGSQLVNQPTASADAQGCSSASGGYVCTYVGGSGRYVSYVTASRGKNGSICRSSAWVYAISPSGSVTGLGHQARANCAVGRAWFGFALNRSFASGTRICSKFMEAGTPVGGEPCIWIR